MLSGETPWGSSGHWRGSMEGDGGPASSSSSLLLPCHDEMDFALQYTPTMMF